MGTDIFDSIELDDVQKQNMQIIRKSFADMYDQLDNIIPYGREKSLYETKLEEACMWAIKALSREEYGNPKNLRDELHNIKGDISSLARAIQTVSNMYRSDMRFVNNQIDVLTDKLNVNLEEYDLYEADINLGEEKGV